MVRVIYLLTFVSGFAALLYEMIWTRQLSLVLGSSTAAVSTVVAAYMGGIALGSALIGRWADRWRNLLLGYAGLEFGVAVASLAVMWAIPAVQSIYPALLAVTGENSEGVAAIRIALTLTLLLAPTCLMGGTFPVLVRAVARDQGELGSTAGTMYGLNTFGAVAGCFAAGMFLLGAVGVDRTGYLAISLNLAVGAAALMAASRFQRLRAGGEGAPLDAASLRAKAVADVAVNGGRSDGPMVEDRMAALDSTANEGTLPPARRRAILAAIAVSGFVSLGYEIVWSRALGIVIGHSIYAFTLVLCTFLAGLAIGGYVAGAVLCRRPAVAELFCFAYLALGASVVATFHLLPVLPFSDYHNGVHPISYVATNLGLCGALLLAPTMLCGALLPMAIQLCATDIDAAGAEIGKVYAWNTVGSIAGSLSTGFALIPWWGVQRGFLLLALVNLAVAGALVARLAPGRLRTVLIAALLIFVGRSFAVSRGSPIVRDKSLQRVEAALGRRVTLEYFAEGQVASVGLCREEDGLVRLFANGELMTHPCLETVWMAHLPMAIAPEPRHVLVLCLGMGTTFQTALQYDADVTGVELSANVVEAVRQIQGDALVLGPEDRLVVGDARNEVLVAQRKYDVITADPPPPLYSAGSVNFHTREFYQSCRERLTERGVLCQWIPFGHCTVDEYRMLLRTFCDVFPRMAAWTPPTPLGPTGLYLVAWSDEVDYDVDRVRQALLAPRVAANARRFSDQPLEELLPVELLRDEQARRFCGDAPVMTDLRPWLEFPLLRNAFSPGPLMSIEPVIRFLERDAGASFEIQPQQK